jgi:broad specificity phosphatase PhoE
VKIYFVRHGKSTAGDEGKRQGPKTPLSKIGRQQSEKVARRFENIRVDHLLSSEWTRASETAEIIGQHIDLPVSYITGIHEKETHPDLYYADHKGDLQKKFVKDIIQNGNDPDWKFQNQGESVNELAHRALTFSEYLMNNYRHRSIVVVSHSLFINAFTTSILFKSSPIVDGTAYMSVFETLSFENTGITKIEYVEYEHRWRVRFVNDVSHFK